MRENNITIRDALTNGLAPDERNPRNAPFLESCLNMVPSEWGCATPPPITPVADVVQWPFPQVFRGRDHTLLFGHDTLHVHDGTEFQPVTLMNFYYAQEPDEIVPGGPWQFMDFWGTWMAFNGQCEIVNAAHLPSPRVQSVVKVRSGCNLKNGRAIFGGFRPGGLNSWHTRLRQCKSIGEDCVQMLLSGAEQVDENWVWWSSIGGGDLTSLFEVSYTGLDPYYELWLRGESGFAPMPWRGPIHAVKALDESAIVYGEDGVSALTPRGSAMGVRPIAGLGKQVGIASRGCVAGDDRAHIFISSDRDLWLVSPDLQAQRLGYRRIFENYDPEKTVMSLDTRLRHFWIADGDQCHVLSKAGLGGPIQRIPTSFYRDAGQLYGVRHAPTRLQIPIEVRSSTFDMLERADKHVSTVQVGSRGASQVRVRVRGDDKQTQWTATGPERVAYPRLSGTDLQLSVRGLVPAASEGDGFERIEIRYNAEDLRHRRGTKGVFEQHRGGEEDQ